MRRLTRLVLATAAATLWIDGLIWRTGEAGPVGWALEEAVPVLFLLPPLFVSAFAARKKAWREAALCGVVAAGQIFGPMGLCLGHASEERGDLRVATYNVEKFDASPEAVAAVLRGLDADVILLQEASYWTDLELPARFRGAMPGYHVYAEAGMAILSKRPLRDAETRNFPIANVPTGWNVQEARIDVGGREVRVLNVHMVPQFYQPDPHLPQMGLLERVETVRRYRKGQIDEVLRRAGAGSLPTVVGGDFNQQPYGPGYRRLAGPLTDSVRATSFGFDLTIPSAFPLKRVDYVWTRGLRALRAHAVPARASDHLPVVAELKLD